MASLSTSTFLVLAVLACLTPMPSALSSWRSAAQLSGLLGGPSEMSDEMLKSETVQQAAQFAVQRLNLRSSSSEAPYILVKVLSGTSQVVAGIRYKMVLEIGQSKLCQKNMYGTVTSSNCPVNQSTVKTWGADVWMKPTNPVQFVLNDLQEY